MTGEVVEVQPVIEWMQKLLYAATGCPVGDADAPDEVQSQDDPYPYYVITTIDSSRWGPPLITTDRHLDLIIQVDAIGRRTDQARVAQDRARSAVLATDEAGRYLHDPSGSAGLFKIVQRSYESGPFPPVGEGERPDRVYTVAERYTIRTLAKEAT